MTLKNSYSLSPRVFEDIQKQLRTHGAKQVTLEYGPGERVTSISFAMEINGALTSFCLPARFENVEKIFKKTKRAHFLSPTQKDQAYRTAWANIRDWVAAQMALIETEMVTPEEVFLPYLITPSGATLYDAMKEHQFRLLEYKNDLAVEVIESQ